MKKFMLEKAAAAAASLKPVALTAATTTNTRPPLNGEQQQAVNNLRAMRCLDLADPKTPKIYEQRKAMKPAYVELFKALFKIPDKQVQQRVLDAINGVTSNGHKCVECEKRVKERQCKNISTQTEQQNAWNNAAISDESRDATTRSDKGAAMMELTNDELQPLQQPQRRKRRRKNRLPRVIKKSQTIHTLPKEQPLLRKSICTIAEKPVKVSESMEENICAKRRRSDSLSLMYCDSEASFGGILDLNDHDPLLSKRQLSDEVILKTMAMEFLSADDCINGFLPIHDAIQKNELNRLRRQIYVWKNMKKANINEILTEDDEDCLQLAISNNSFEAIIKVLIESGCDVNCCYDGSNSALHLAILHELDRPSIVCITQHIDMKQLLLTNDDGYTPLFLAVRANQYLEVEAIMNVIDGRLKLPGYNRTASSFKVDVSVPAAPTITTATCTLKEFTEFYMFQAERVQGPKPSKEFSKKQAVLNMGDRKSGTTMLFYCIENKLEHFIYFFLAHLADPLVPNLSGQDAKFFLAEYGRSLKINSKVDLIVEYIAKVLH